MNDSMGKGLTAFFSIAIVALIIWAVSFCCCFAYYHFRKQNVDDGTYTEMTTCQKSGVKSNIGESQIQSYQPNAV